MNFQLDTDALRVVAQTGQPGLLDGRLIANAILEQLTKQVERMRASGNVPCLAVVQVEGDAASSIYVKHKMRACARIGVESQRFLLPNDTTAQTLTSTIERLNQNPDVHGILLQLPLPASLEPGQFIQCIDPLKDVDGLHPHNMGYLIAWSAMLEPCTPRGIMRLLDAYDVNLVGKHAVVVGRSQLVGRPMAQMFLRAHATTTICHRHTASLAEQVAKADILVVATGVPHLIKGEWVKQGAVVVDVGTTRIEGNRLVGDVDFDIARSKTHLISPVPGGVGPMTVATLMENTVRAATVAFHGQS